MVRQKWGLDGKKIYFLDDKNDCYYHLISTTGKKKRASWVHLHSFCLCHFNDNIKIQGSFDSKPKQKMFCHHLKAYHGHLIFRMIYLRSPCLSTFKIWRNKINKFIKKTKQNKTKQNKKKTVNGVLKINVHYYILLAVMLFS